MSAEEGASIVVSGFTALQSVRQGGIANVNGGSEHLNVLITGASGGVGILVVQVINSRPITVNFIFLRIQQCLRLFSPLPMNVLSEILNYLHAALKIRSGTPIHHFCVGQSPQHIMLEKWKMVVTERNLNCKRTSPFC